VAPSGHPALSFIGVVRSGRTELADTPVQSALNPDEQAVLELDPAYADALLGLDGFDYAWLLTWLGPTDGPGDRPSDGASEPVKLRQVPFLHGSQPREYGILATRGPRRINPIGLSLVRLGQIDGTSIHFSGVDVIDGTPVVDLKPYVTRFDRPPEEPDDVRCGWFDGISMPLGATPGQLRNAEPETSG
jgi:tRNA (adenine37-N6)-methyltransferase